MTLPHLIERRSHPRPQFQVVSSTSTYADWQHPTLDFDKPAELPQHTAKLFLIPSLFGEEFDVDEYPQPTSTRDLPDIKVWVSTFLVSLIEIWSGRRQPAQLITRCHRVIFHSIMKSAGMCKEIPRLRNIHIQEPLDGLCEVTATLRFNGRLRALVLRIEGVDGRWLCTVLEVI